MLRLPQLGVETPRTVEEAVGLLTEPGARLVAGGTDILPNLKHHLDAPPRNAFDRVAPGFSYDGESLWTPCTCADKG